MNLNKVNETTCELVADEVVINSLNDAVDLLGNASFSGATGVLIEQKHLSDEFFDLKTRFAGEILQKFANYGMKLVVIGDLSRYDGNAWKSFLIECNKSGWIRFVASREEAITSL